MCSTSVKLWPSQIKLSFHLRNTFLYKETNVTLLKKIRVKSSKQINLIEQYLTNDTHRQLDDELQHSMLHNHSL